MTHLVPLGIENQILIIRDLKVMVDFDLARLYGVTTKRLNEQVKRNLDRFPPDFMFELTSQETAELVANCDRFKRLKHSSARLHAFTEHGAIMLASVLKSSIAVQASIQVVRAFVRFRDLLATHSDLARKLEGLEKKFDRKFRVVFDAIRALTQDPKRSVVQVKGFQKD
jgi:hypothetical protein